MTDSKPVDVNSSLYAELSSAIDYYLTKQPASSRKVGAIEQIALPHTSYLNKTEEIEANVREKYFKTVRKYKIADIIKAHRSILICWNCHVINQIKEAQALFAEDSGSSY